MTDHTDRLARRMGAKFVPMAADVETVARGLSEGQRAAKDAEIERLTIEALDAVENLIDLAIDEWGTENPDIKRAIQFRGKCRAALKASTHESP